MKRTLIGSIIIAAVVIWMLPTGLTAQEAGQCYFEATEDIYLKIYKLDKDGVERWRVWEGHLSEGGTKSFNAPYGQVGYATKKNPDDPWEESQEDCMEGNAIQIP
jgi:hypothetical protein